MGNPGKTQVRLISVNPTRPHPRRPTDADNNATMTDCRRRACRLATIVIH